MALTEEMQKLEDLREAGSITQEEYEEAQALLLAQQNDAVDMDTPPKSEDDAAPANLNTWAMFIHLGQFAHAIVPMAGVIVPIVLWQLKKDESPLIDAHGKAVVNWIITEFILGAIFFALSFVFIGIPLLIILGLVGVIFPIIGALKANSGEVWRYPGSFNIIK